MDLAYNSPWSFDRTSHLIVYLSVLADDITTLLLNESFFMTKIQFRENTRIISRHLSYKT